MQRRGGSGQPAKGQSATRPKARNTPTAQVATAGLQEQLDRRTRERDEALEQQAATAEVLKVISRSTFDLPAVLNTLIKSACCLCGADIGTIRFEEGDRYCLAATYGCPPEWHSHFAGYSGKPDKTSVFGQTIIKGATVHIPDVLEDSDFARPQAQKLMGLRAALGVPLVRDGHVFGVVNLFRTTPIAFTQKQIELAETFADQAVIAIENTRLLNELRERTDDLSKSLQQQTATADVLKVISSSPGDMKPVFETMLTNALRICEAKFGHLLLNDGECFHAAHLHDVPPAYREYWQKHGPIRPGPNTGLGRIVCDKQMFHIPDLKADAAYAAREPLRVVTVEQAGARSFVGVPMLKEDKLVGAIVIYRQEVRPFTERQIELLKNFAAQAVIAIDNMRLLNELRESLQHQTATSEILASISGAMTDTKPVFDAIVRNLLRLFGTCFATIQLLHDGIVEMPAAGGEAGIEKIMGLYPRPLDDTTAGGQAMLLRQVVQFSPVVGNPLAPQGAQQIASKFDYNSIIAAPMIRQDKVIGAIICAHREQRVFNEKEVALIRAFSDQAVIAIENVRLFDEVQGRTRELAASLDDLRTTQDRLVQTQKLALLGQLTAGIAHEIKNPLNFVNNFSGISAELIGELQDTLKGMPLDDKARTEINELTDTLKSNFDKVVHHGRRADAIVKNMLQHSREGSGEHRVIDINALVEESVNLAWHGARAETQGFEVKLRQSFDPSAGGADVFPQDIRRALLNLIANGFHAATRRRAETNGGDYEPTLTASTKNLGDRVEVRIRDNGTGMTPDVKEKMFNPFFTTKPTGEGTGLGLSISHDVIVKQHAGTIEVDTQPGEFTEIRIVLPRTPAFV